MAPRTRKKKSPRRPTPSPPPGPQGGRPAITLGEFELRQIEALAGYGLTEAAIAHCMLMGARTLRDKKEHDTAVSAALEKGKALAEGNVAKALYVKAIKGDLGAIVWWEKTRAGRKEVSKIEQAIGPEELHRILTELGRVIELHVTDPEIRTKIREGWRELRFT